MRPGPHCATAGAFSLYDTMRMPSRAETSARWAEPRSRLHTPRSALFACSRCSDETTWCRYAEWTGLVTPIDAVITRSAGSATQKDEASPTATAAAVPEEAPVEETVTSQNFIHSSKLGDSSRSLGGNHHVPAVHAVTNSALNAASVFQSRRIEISDSHTNLNRSAPCKILKSLPFVPAPGMLKSAS